MIATMLMSGCNVLRKKETTKTDSLAKVETLRVITSDITTGAITQVDLVGEFRISVDGTVTGTGTAKVLQRVKRVERSADSVVDKSEVRVREQIKKSEVKKTTDYKLYLFLLGGIIAIVVIGSIAKRASII